VYKGKRDQVEKSQATPFLEISDNSAVYAAIFSALRGKRPISAAQPMVKNTVVAGDSTYYGFADIIINRGPGDYYFKFEIAPTSQLAGYTTKPTINLNIVAIPLDEGYNVAEDEVMHVSKKASSTGFSSSGREFSLMSETELGGIVSSCSFDEKFDTTAIVMMEDIANSKIAGCFTAGSGSGFTGQGANYTLPIEDPSDTTKPLWVIYKSAQSKQTFSCSLSTATTCYFASMD
jgi:hypothetical protein